MQKFTIENASATLRGPVDLRLFDMGVQQRNAGVMGARWPVGGQFSLAEGQKIALEPGDVVMVSDPVALEDVAAPAPARRKVRGKAEEAGAD